MALDEGRRGAERIMQEVSGSKDWKVHHGFRRAHARLMHGLHEANRIAPLQGASLTAWLCRAKPMIRAEALRGGAEADDVGEDVPPSPVPESDGGPAPAPGADVLEADPDADVAPSSALDYDAGEAPGPDVLEMPSGDAEQEETAPEAGPDATATADAGTDDAAGDDAEGAPVLSDAQEAVGEASEPAAADAAAPAGPADDTVSEGFRARLSKIHALLEAAPRSSDGIDPASAPAGNDAATDGAADSGAVVDAPRGGAFPMIPNASLLRKKPRLNWSQQQALRGGSSLVPMARPQGSQAALEALSPPMAPRTLTYKFGGNGDGFYESVAGGTAPRRYY